MPVRLQLPSSSRLWPLEVTPVPEQSSGVFCATIVFAIVTFVAVASLWMPLPDTCVAELLFATVTLSRSTVPYSDEKSRPLKMPPPRPFGAWFVLIVLSTMCTSSPSLKMPPPLPV